MVHYRYNRSLDWRKRAMKCPYCAYLESKVVDSRPADEGASIRRRRECLSCHKRFTTYEMMESLPLVVGACCVCVDEGSI